MTEVEIPDGTPSEGEAQQQTQQQQPPPTDVQIQDTADQSIDIDGTERPQEPGTEEKLLAGKFKTPEELERAYKELETKLGQQTEETPPSEGLGIKPEQEGQESDDTVTSLDAFADKFAQQGKLEDDDYKSLEKKHGIKREMVDRYIAGQQALQAHYEREILAAGGGHQDYGRMVEWARGNLTPQEIEAFDNVVNSGDVNAAKMAVSGLRARFQAAGGVGAIQGAGTRAPESMPFRSDAELVEAMMDPRYQRDEAYTQEVMARLRASPDVMRIPATFG